MDIRLILVFAFFFGSAMFFGNLFEVYFFGLGLPIEHIILSSTLLFLPPIILMFLIRRIDPRKWIIASTLLVMVSAILLLLVKDPFLLFAVRFLIGISFFFFWIPFNILYYEKRENNHAYLGSIYYGTMLLLSLFIPGIAGYIAMNSGFDVLFMISALVLSFNIFLTYRLVRKDALDFDPMEAINEVKPLSVLLFLEGFSIHAILQTLAVMILIYFTDPLGFGLFLSGVTVFSIIASLVLSRLSDRMNDRKSFLMLSGSGFFLAAVATFFANDAAVFFLAYGGINFFRSLLSPIPFALVVDRTSNLVNSMVAREFYLNAGRVVSLLLGFFLIVFINIHALLLVQALFSGAYLFFAKKDI